MHPSHTQKEFWRMRDGLVQLVLTQCLVVPRPNSSMILIAHAENIDASETASRALEGLWPRQTSRARSQSDIKLCR